MKAHRATSETSNVPDARTEVYLTPRQLACRWSVSIETTKRRRRAGILQAYQFGRGVRFALSEILAYEEKARI